MALCWCSTMTMMSGAYKQPQKGKGMGKGKGKGKAQTKQRQSRGSDGIGFGGKRNDPTWQCIQGCGACCKLDKGPSFATPEEIFDDPSDVKLYRSMVGPDGWCIHYEKSTRTCSIYSDRPYFCRVEPNVFQTLYGIGKKRFNKEACSLLAVSVKIPSRQFMALIHKSWIILFMQYGAQILVKLFGLPCYECSRF